ncbi:hypothetical protein H8784_14020 [Parabacteroides acidifaciens]|uniref:DUF4858 domain-containing protein n=1 Tax=Parabacteroides acidifaciens TaxID=2290935 RepID=A0A3D8HCU2_9BACT|nr:hypothetical protein [Parabacteroides acidifaciens]MBC8602831.1 hypothetical protein [Parabacteroides acidifaciens]RDU48452.1 hypothetical protein DWU89_14380 [Parabacteroides acidifaciens]
MCRCWLILLFLVLYPVVLFAQNSLQEDSIWVSEMLAGKDTIRINPEYLKAIEEGTLINMGQPSEYAPSELPVLKDFSEYIKADTLCRALELDSISPAVFWLYPADTAGMHIRGIVYKPLKSLVIRDRIRFGKLPLYGKVGTQNLFLPEVKDGQRRGSVGATLTVDFSMEDMLRYVFWKSERDKKRNRKRDFTWKHYNSYP